MSLGKIHLPYELYGLILCAALALGEALGFAASPAAGLWPLVAGLTVPLALLGYAFRVRGTLPATLFAAGFALALRSAAARQAVFDEAFVRHSGKPCPIHVTVGETVSVRTDRTGQRWASFSCERDTVRLRVYCPVPADGHLPEPGDRWTCAGWLARNPEGTGGRYAFWVKGKGTWARPVDAESLRAPSRMGAFFAALRRRAKNDLAKRLGLGLADAPKLADLHRAILLGERTRLSRTQREDFIAAGTVHIFAISGLHVVILAHLFAYLLLVTRLPVRLSGLVLVPLLWAYTYLVGLTPSAVRATTMLTLDYLAPLAWRRPNGLVAWSLTFLAVYGLSPGRLQDVGCGLSFSVMLVLALWGRWGVRTDSKFKDALLFTFVAWTASLPIAAHVFGRITPGGLVTNLAIGPLAFATVIGVALGALASFISSDLAALINSLTALGTELMTDLSSAVASVPGASFTVAPWSYTLCLLWYAFFAFAVLAVFRYRRHRLL